MARRITFEVAEEKQEEVVASVTRAPSLSGMAKSLQAAAASTVREIPLDQIEASGFRDRLELQDEDIEDLASSIKAQGQLIPILVSPLPQGRFRIVYGRRRLEALRRLGLSAKALVREMDDTQAILAQGQENTYRKDLSWIEKASFARQLLEDGRSDDLICDALNIDQKARRNGEKLTGLSRMRQVTSRISPVVIAAIGPAPKVGRDRWYDLSQKLERMGLDFAQQESLIASIEHEDSSDSDARFELFETAIATRNLSQRSGKSITSTDAQTSVGQVRATNRQASIIISAKEDAHLHAWIKDNPQAAIDALLAAVSAHNNNKKEQG